MMVMMFYNIIPFALVQHHHPHRHLRGVHLQLWEQEAQNGRSNKFSPTLTITCPTLSLPSPTLTPAQHQYHHLHNNHSQQNPYHPLLSYILSIIIITEEQNQTHQLIFHYNYHDIPDGHYHHFREADSSTTTIWPLVETSPYSDTAVQSPFHRKVVSDTMVFIIIIIIYGYNHIFPVKCNKKLPNVLLGLTVSLQS